MAVSTRANQKKKILLADPDAHFLAQVRPLLEYDGYAVSSVMAGGSVLSGFNEYDLIISSDVFADMSGAELIAQLQKQNCKPPILFLISPGGDGSNQGCPSGVTQVLQKPLNGPHFLRKVAELLLPPEEDDEELSQQLRILQQEYIAALQGQVQAIERAAALLEQETADQETFNGALTYAHRIRGTAGSYGFSQIGLEAGRVEDLLKRHRQGEPLQGTALMLAVSQIRAEFDRIARTNLG